MKNYDLTPADIQNGINRLLTDAYSSSTISDKPTIVYITAGPGAGKTAMEVYFKKYFKNKGQRPFVINSDKIAEYHPNYEDVLEELPEDCYRITRQFVKLTEPTVFDGLIKNRINIINEKTFNKGNADIELVRKIKESGYKVSINIIATDIFESSLSCYEREAAMLLAGLTPRGCSKENQTRMYNSFVAEVQELDKLGLCDEINVYVRGENISKPPVLKYSKDSNSYRDFYEAVISERAKQRQTLVSNPTEYLLRIKKAEEVISEYGVNEVLTQNSLNGLKELRNDFIQEVAKEQMSR